MAGEPTDVIWLLLMLPLSLGETAGVAGQFPSKAACESVASVLFPDRPWACRAVEKVVAVA